jgi:glucans biosynthesis protein
VIPIAETRSGKTPDKRRQLFVIDYASSEEALSGGVEASISTSAGTIENPVVKRNPETGTTRLTFELAADNASVAELRALLTKGGQPVSETWLYRWRAE